jgi:hypothetical protein
MTNFKSTSSFFSSLISLYVGDATGDNDSIFLYIVCGEVALAFLIFPIIEGC